MKLPDALSGTRQLGFDTAPLIYFVERHPDYFERMLFIMRYVDQGLIDGVTSALTLAEVLVQPLRSNNAELAARYEAVLTRSRNFRVEPLTTKTARLVAQLRARHNLRTPDALQVATAIDAGCESFLTNDKEIRRVTELAVLALDDLQLDAAST